MSTPLARYADWKAPDEDGQLLIWPDVPTLLRESRENHQRLANVATLIQNIPLADLRRQQRHLIGHANADQPLIATGHQAELYHPGVWVKDVLASAIARRLDAAACHFAVDTDSPKHLRLRWPGGSLPITDDARLNTAAWTALLDAPTPAHRAELRHTFDDACLGWDFEPAVDPFLAALDRASANRPNLSAAVTAAIQTLDADLGLAHRALAVSSMWASQPYLVFAHHLLARAGQFASQYNDALSAYRREQGITTPGRPMPDLKISADEVEAPFWIDDLTTGARNRLTLSRVNDAWTISRFSRPARGPSPTAQDSFALHTDTNGHQSAENLQTFLSQHNLRIAPRALTLTMFFRLFLADQFIHGIGGGRYDQVTDRLIATGFNLDPPRFSVTTATLYFPGARGQKRVSLRPLLQEGRRLRHGSFWREKRELADRIATLPRRSPARRDLFFQMHADLSKNANSQSMRDWTTRLDQATRDQMRQKTLFDRELFYAIQPEERLREMISRYDARLNETGILN